MSVCVPACVSAFLPIVKEASRYRHAIVFVDRSATCTDGRRVVRAKWSTGNATPYIPLEGYAVCEAVATAKKTTARVKGRRAEECETPVHLNWAGGSIYELETHVTKDVARVAVAEGTLPPSLIPGEDDVIAEHTQGMDAELIVNPALLIDLLKVAVAAGAVGVRLGIATKQNALSMRANIGDAAGTELEAILMGREQEQNKTHGVS